MFAPEKTGSDYKNQIAKSTSIDLNTPLAPAVVRQGPEDVPASQLGQRNYPIIMIHGYCGSTMDENIYMGGYFHYAFS